MKEMEVKKEGAIQTGPEPKKRRRWTKDDTELTLLAMPTFVWYLLFCYLPMFGVIIAFKNYKITPGASFLTSLLKSDWSGFDNFKYFFGLRDFPQILRNTILYNVASQNPVPFPHRNNWCC